MYKIAVENLPALFRKIAADQELYLPVKVSEQVNFKAWSEDAEVSLETLKTVKSPKDAYFPQMLQPGSSRENFSGSLSQKKEML